MKRNAFVLSVVTTTFLSAPAMAQTAIGDSDAQNRIDALNENIADDFERNPSQFGNESRPTGFSGSMALQASATSGNTETSTIGLGANMGYYDGINGYGLRLSYQRSENEGVVSEDSLLYEFQYRRDLQANYYGFGKLQGSIDSLTNLDTSDNFAGLGLGYRIYDTAAVQWTVEAGIGYRVADLGGLDDFDEGALSLSSSYYNKLSDTLAVTNDTDVIGSETDTVVYNDLGLNVSMTDALALRTSVVSEYHTDPVGGRKDLDNTFGVSLVFGFN